MRRARLIPLLAIVAVLAGCGSVARGGDATLRIVAAESFWGSIAKQLAGPEASVASVVVNPAQDPHAYEPSTADARGLATAQLAILDGIGYDRWAAQLLSANPTAGRLTLDVGQLLGLQAGENPHRWYDPADVETVAGAITADLSRLAPRRAAYFNARLRAFSSTGLAGYHALIAAISRRYGGVPVGASESIFALLAPALRLDLRTPPSFMKATSEGTEVSARDMLTTQRQIERHEIRAWIDNSQNATPQIQQLNAIARRARIPIVTITETLTPVGDTFEQWQVSQLRALAQALAQATGR